MYAFSLSGVGMQGLHWLKLHFWRKTRLFHHSRALDPIRHFSAAPHGSPILTCYLHLRVLPRLKISPPPPRGKRKVVFSGIFQLAKYAGFDFTKDVRGKNRFCWKWGLGPVGFCECRYIAERSPLGSGAWN